MGIKMGVSYANLSVDYIENQTCLLSLSLNATRILTFVFNLSNPTSNKANF